MAPVEPGTALRGSLELFPLCVVLGMLREAGTTGRLELTTPTGHLFSAIEVRLSIESGNDEGPLEIDEREHEIGRSATHDVRIDHGSVSRRHARVVPRSGRFVITGVVSTRGARVDGEPLTGERVLRGGESIALGDVVLRFDYVKA